MGYECLITGLPDVRLGDAAPMSIEALESLLEETLCQKDKEQLHLMKVHAREGACDFILDWLDFNRTINNVLTAEVCRKHNLPLKSNILGEMPDDVEPEVKAISRLDNLYERERRIDALRFAWLEERTRMIFFSLENILAYYLMTEILNRWALLTPEKGEIIFRNLVSDMKGGIDLSKV